MIGIILLTSFVAATDVIYLVSSQSKVNPIFTDALDDLGLSYEVSLSGEANTTDFSLYDMILLNNEYFSNSEDIPVNDYPALMVNGKNLEEWGWVTYISKSKQNSPFSATIIEENHTITNGFSGDVPVYNDKDANLYSLDNYYIFDGIQILVSMVQDQRDAVIGIAEAGTTLTKAGEPDTIINGNSVFFGIAETQYWTNETEQLFKNSILWLLERNTYNVTLDSGINLISSPLVGSNSVAELMLDNPQIISIKEYNGSDIVDATTIVNGKGYFIESSSGFTLVLEGEDPTTESITLNDGMNLVGVTSFSNINFSTLPIEVIEVSKKVNGNYETATRYSGGWYNEFELEPEKGYWFKLDGGAVWSYP